MKAFLDYLYELSSCNPPKYIFQETEFSYITKKIIGKRVGKSKKDFSDTINILEFFSSCKEWRMFHTTTSGGMLYYICWVFQIKAKQLLWRFL